MNVLNNILKTIRFLLNHPLSLLRVSLSVLLGKKLIEELDFVFEIGKSAHYELSRTWFTQWLPDTLFVFDTAHYNLYYSLILAATLGAALGLLGRLNLLILAFFSLYLYGFTEGIGIFDHHMSLPTQVILALALVPGSMKLSIDYLVTWWFSKRKNKPFTMSNNPKWGFNLILCLVALTYFTAGVSKLRYGNGLQWLDGSTLGFYLQERTDLYKKGDVQIIIGDADTENHLPWKDNLGFIAHTYGNYQTSPNLIAIANYVANNKILLIALAIGSVLFELLAFIVFINSKYRNIYLISAILFHLSIGALMGISFRQYRLICFLLIDWNLILNYVLNKIKKFKPQFTNKLSTE